MNDQKDSLKLNAQRYFVRARRQASVRQIRSTIIRQCNDLLPATAVFNELDLDNRQDRGIQSVPLDRVVGSSGRYRDFDLKFMPRQRQSNGRWTNIADALFQGKRLPHVLLYKVGQVYFVEDGNHRVSVARTIGKESILAHVIEFDSSILRPEPTCQRLGFALANNKNSCKE